MATSQTPSRAKQAAANVADSSRALASRAGDLAHDAQVAARDAAAKVQSTVKAHPVATTVGLAALVGAVVGILAYRRKH